LMSLEREQHLKEKINKSYANRLTKVNNKCDINCSALYA
jgi:GTP1/Obg family GTP-binding protein